MICPETKRACEKCCDMALDDVVVSDVGVCYYRSLRALWFWIGFAACGAIWMFVG